MAKILALSGVGLVLLLLAIGLRSVTIDVPFALNPSEMQSLKGEVYEVPMKRRLGWPWQPISDNPHSPRRSSLLLFEDGQLSGRAHTLYDQIETVGGGDYVHWGNSLFFSTTDNSDPRVNGRHYHGMLKAGITHRLLRQLTEFGSLLVVVALGVAAWLRRRRFLELLHRGLMHVQSRAGDYALALAAPATVSAAMLLLLPPTWNGSDSVIWLLWQWHWVPHHPPVYPALTALAAALFDDPLSVVRFVITIQHAATVLAIGYLASADRRRWRILVLSLASTVGVVGGLYAQGLYTEGLATAFFFVFLGAMLRLHRDGPTWPVLVGLGAGLLAASLTRHAYLVFAATPLVYLGLVLVFSRSSPILTRVRPLLAVGALFGGVVLSNNLIVQYTCLMLDSQCTSITGRAGVYRMQDAYALVPAADRPAWLAALVERAPDAAVAEAIPVMVTTPEPWAGPRDALALQTALSGANEDHLMNQGFGAFLSWPDRFVLLQWWRQIQLAMLGTGGAGYCTGHASCVLLDSARSIETVFPSDPRALDAVPGTGAEVQASAAQYRELEQLGVMRALDALLPLEPARRWVYLLLSLTLGLAAMIRCSSLGFSALIVALWSGAVAYVLALTLFTVVLPRYLLPIDNLLWLSNAVALIGLLSRRPDTMPKPG